MFVNKLSNNKNMCIKIFFIITSLFVFIYIILKSINIVRII